MSTIDEVVAFEAKIKSNGLRVDDVLRKAGIDRSTWTRWKAGTTVPRLDNWRSIEKALSVLSANPIGPAPKKEGGRAA